MAPCKFILFIFIAVLPASVFATTRQCTEQEQAGYVKLEDLEYLGFTMSGKSYCVKAASQSAAVNFCGRAPIFSRAVNPANPQYGNKIPGGSLSSNPEGYYYCVDTTPELADFKTANQDVEESLISQNMSQMTRLNDKEQLCRVANRLSPWLKDQPDLRFVWVPRGNDGDCMCGVNGQRRLCDSAPPERVAGTPAPPPPVAPVAVSVAAAPPVAPVATSAPAAPSVSEQLNSCVQEFIEDSESCKEESEKAKNSCDQRNNNNTGNNTSAVLASGASQIMGQVYNMRHQASGMQAECFRAGAVANTASVAINGMQSRCEIDFSNCNRLCMGQGGESKVEEFRRVCAQRVNKTAEQILSERTPDQQPTPDAQLFSNAVNTINQNIGDSSRVCTVEAAGNRDKLGQLADGVGRALQSSVQCACQLAASGTNCENIPSVQDCSSFPQPAGCGAYDAMTTCAVGSTGYNAKECQCMQNPSSPGCGGGANAVSAFAGPPIANNLARGAADGGANFSGSAGGGGSGSGFSIGANGEVENSDLGFLDGKKTGGGTAAANSAGGGGSAGPGGSSNGNAGEDKGALTGEEDTGIKGVFSQAKTFMSNALGLGKKPGSSASGKSTLGQPDLNKFKPKLRGIASSANGMGSRNMDIWTMMNACMSGTTCKSNENNYLTTP